jgi:hypothetical protein
MIPSLNTHNLNAASASAMRLTGYPAHALPGSAEAIARRHPIEHAPGAKASPSFGRLSLIAEKFFQPVTENYLWGFMAQDVLGLWIPRIYSSLERGRIPYDRRKDTKYGTRTPQDQKRFEWWRTIKGLNYWNGWEETAREIQNGPGIFTPAPPYGCLVSVAC